MDMGDGSSFIDEFSHSDLFGVDNDGASGFEWADEILSSSEGGEKSNADNLLETSVVNNIQQTVQYAQTNQHLSSQANSVNVQYIQSTTNTTVQQAAVHQVQQPTQIIPNLTNLAQGGGQLIQGVNGQIFLKPLPNGQFQLATQPQIQQIQHPQQSSSPIPIQPLPQGSPHVNINQSPIPISSPHVITSSASPHSSRSVTPLQQTRQFQNVSMLQVPGSASQQQIIRNLPLTSQISNIGTLQAQQIIQSQGHAAVHNPGQNYVNTQNTVIQNPNVVNVNVAHVLCPNQFQGQQGQNIQGTLIQTADGKQIIIPNSQLPAQNPIQIQNVQQVLQSQLNMVPSSSATGSTPLVQGGQVVENNAATLGGLGLIRIATPSSSSHDGKVQNIQTVQPQQPTHFLGVNQQGQQIIIQRTPTPGQNIVLRPSNILQLPQQQTQPTSQATQQILLPQVQRIVTGQGQQHVKIVTPSNLQTGNFPMTLNIGGQNIILPSNFQQLLQQQQPQQTQSNQNLKPSNSSENIHIRSSPSVQMASALPSSQVATPVSSFHVNSSTMNNFSVASSMGTQVQTFLVPQVTSGTANMTTVTTTVSQNRQSVANVSMSNSPTMFQTIPSVATTPSTLGSSSANQKSFLSAVTNAPKLPMATIQLSPQVQQQMGKIQAEIKKLASLQDPTDQQKQQLNNYRELLKQLIVKAQVKIQSSKVAIQPASTTSQSSSTPSFISVPIMSLSTPSSQYQVLTQATTGTIQQTQNVGNILPQTSAALPAHGLVATVQSQSGVLSPSPALASKAPQSVVIQTPVSTMLVTSQTGPVQGQAISGIMQSGASTNVTSSTAGTAVKGLPGSVFNKVPIGPNSQVAVPTQLKIANHVLTLNLTPDQKEKVQGYLAKMPIEQQQQQMALFLKLQQQQKLNAQVQAQLEHQKRLQTGGQSTSNVQSQVPLTVQPLIPSTSSGTVIVEQPGVSPTKPNIIHRVSVAAIPKHQLIHQQLGKDQANAVITDTKTPFQSQRDMYRRLLRYHVFQTKNPPEHLVKKDDEMFADLSEGLVRKKNWMFDKYRSLLLEESMREQQTAEIMMIQKMLNEDLKEVLEDERKTAKRNPDEFDPMPRKYLRLGSQSVDDEIQETKVDPQSIRVKVEKSEVPSPLPATVKKEVSDSESRPSTPKFKLVIKSDGQRYSSTITEEEGNDSGGTNFMRGISVKEEQVDPDDSVPYSDNVKPFDLYSGDRKSQNLSDISDDLADNGADSDSDVTIVSDGEKTNDPIVIDEEDEEDYERSSSEDNQVDVTMSPTSHDPVIKHEDISSDFTDLFSNRYRAGSSELSFYTKASSKPSDNALSDFLPSDQISNDFANSQSSDAQSTRTIPYSEDGNSLKDEDLNDELDYNNKSTSSFAHYEPISSPEADHNDSSFSNYFNSSSSYNIGGIGDQNMGYSMTHSVESDNHMTNHVTDSPSWTEEENENADQIKAEMESAISSILDLN